MAEQEGEDIDWAGYYAYLGDRPPRPLFVRALEEYGEVVAGAVAVDLGCGSGIETRALLEAGFSVTAIDSSPDSMLRLAELAELTGHDGRLTSVQSAMQDADIPGAGLVYAGFALPFCPPREFGRLWRSIRTAIEPGGLLAVDLFGVRDAWAGEPDLTFVTRERLTDLLVGLDVRSLHEIEEEGQAYAGPKHWHRFEVLARA
jgi:trans-aconitate methyltransferase